MILTLSNSKNSHAVTSHQSPILDKNMSKNSVAYDKAYQFAIRIIKAYKYLNEEYKEYILSKQLLRSGTSIGANLAEANSSISEADFSAKVSITYKEYQQTKYWLSLLKQSPVTRFAQSPVNFFSFSFLVLIERLSNFNFSWITVKYLSLVTGDCSLVTVNSIYQDAEEIAKILYAILKSTNRIKK